MEEAFFKSILKSHQECKECPSPDQVDRWLHNLLEFLFPDLSSNKLVCKETLMTRWKQLKIQLREILQIHQRAICHNLTEEFFQKIPGLYDVMKVDVKAHFLGDPAAKSEKEVIVSYPGFWAVASYRIAHTLHGMQVPIVPRLIMENAHSKTGIDIHPGATIGSDFCIDHGTGIVIGETTQIGNRVKIYQGVTLGALSVRKEDADQKRHPTIEDEVVIYAGATILGGNTTIGKGSVIGGNVWLTRSIPPASKVYYKSTVHANGQNPVDGVTIKTQ